jgi:hypothetical protein
MSDNHRRSFLKFSSGGVIASLISSMSWTVGASPNVSLPRIAFLTMAKSWQTQEACKPIDYLNSIGISTNTTSEELKNAVREDFLQNRIHKFNGLTLSKTEAALMASMVGSV